MDLLSHDPHAAALSAALGTQYALVGLLGRGGMGAVYLAREPFLDRDVAVKVLPSEVASDDSRQRFLREARTAAKLSHPNIVPLYTFGQAGELLYYVMGFVDGESLETRLRREGRLSFDEARRIACELADALEYAHGMGVVHRDVKPDNVLIDRRSGRAMLTDFGVAKQSAAQETLTQTGVIVGTPHYMSPEQASGERSIDGRSDIYSLGVIAYRMVTGRLPFEGTSMRDVLAQHATRAPLPPGKIVTSLPTDLDTVITRALAKDPAQRWPSARAVRVAMSDQSEEALPDALRDISGTGARLDLLSLGMVEFAILGRVYGFLDRGLITASIASAVGLQLIGLMAVIKPARQFGLRPVLRSYFQQPGWWSSWWPEIGRRTGDIWDRLPKIIRTLRVMNAAAVVVGVGWTNYFLYALRTDYLSSASGRMPLWPTFAIVGTIYGGLIWGYLTLRRFLRSARADGLTRSESTRLITEPTFSRTFWTRPHIASLLLASSTTGATQDASVSSPRDVLRDIESLARDAASSPHADLYKEAVDAARLLTAAIASADEELNRLAQDVDPQEQSRIKESLARTADPKMRDLLERQLQLFRELDVRLLGASERRKRLATQLRTLSLHLAHLRAESAVASASTADISGRIHALVRGIDYRIEGVKETRSLLESR